MRGRFPYIGLFFLLSVIGLAVPGAAVDEPKSVIVRASIVPAEGIWVGQRVRYQVDVLGRNGWARIQRMPDLQVSGAMVVPLETQGTRLNETIGGEVYTGQRYELSLFPQRSGRITIPSLTLDIEISQWGSQSQKRVQKGNTTSVNFMAEQPPGSEKVPWLISTTQLTAEQRWNPHIKKAAVGEAVKRTVQLSAGDISAMAFTPISFVENDRFDLYPGEPEVEDRYNRGILSGRRTESATYLFKKAGSVELPAITLTWWELKTRKLRKTVLPSRVMEISPAATGNDGIPAISTSHGKSAYWIGMFIVVSIVLAALFRNRLHAKWAAWYRKRRNSEHRNFKQFVKTARSGHPVNAFNALMRWLDRIETRGKSAQLGHFLSNYADDATAGETHRLCRAIASESPSLWQGRKLIKGLVRARRNWIVQQRKSEISDCILPHLNPGNAQSKVRPTF